MGMTGNSVCVPPRMSPLVRAGEAVGYRVLYGVQKVYRRDTNSTMAQTF